MAAFLEDLELAKGCVAGDATALSRFESTYTPVMLSTARRFGSADFAKEVAQLVRERLLVPVDGKTRLAEYAGQGPLAGYVQAVTVRLALNRISADSRQPVPGDEVVFDSADGRDDPEVAALKSRYRQEFKLAFAVAMAELPADERAALRLFYIDGLHLADIGRLYGWSVPTASRRLAATRAAVLKGTRAQLATKLKLTTAEVDSVLRLIESRLSVDKLTVD
ncbi:MAG: sigma-70 family RNA polymerase sigma factor [Archangium sp.]